MLQTHTLDEFKLKFCVDELMIIDTGMWTWSLRPEQPTLGSSIISLNRYALHFSDVSSKEMADLADLIKIVERTLKVTFKPDIINYLMLMMVDHHVHYHIIPRYKVERKYDGVSWVDNGWPTLPIISDSQYKYRDGILEAMCGILKASI